MEVQKVSYSESAKINIGNYESREVWSFCEVALSEGDSESEAFQLAYKTVRSKIYKLESKIREFHAKDVDYDSAGKLIK